MAGMNPVIGGFYRHYKGSLYQVREIAIQADTGARMVVYQQMSDKFTTYVCSLVDFTGSASDGSKRFVPVDINDGQINKYVRTAFDSESHSPAARTKPIQQLSIQELVIQFLDENDFEKKDRILSEIGQRSELTDSIIDNLAAAIDVVIDEGSLDKRFAGLRTCVRTRAKYENTRLRG